MLGYPDSEEYPLGPDGNRITVEEFRQGAERHLGGLLPAGTAYREHDALECVVPHPARGSRGLLDCVDILAETDATDYVAKRTDRIAVNKTTHRIRFENETESEVTVVIEPKE